MRKFEQIHAGGEQIVKKYAIGRACNNTANLGTSGGATLPEMRIRRVTFCRFRDTGTRRLPPARQEVARRGFHVSREYAVYPLQVLRVETVDDRRA